MFIGRLMEKLNIPGFVRPFRYYDGLTGVLVEIKTSPNYTKIVVGNYEFFFNRESGKYDGYGTISLIDESSEEATNHEQQRH